MSVYYPEGWPEGRAPAEWYVWHDSDGFPYPGARLWVVLPDGEEDLWSKCSITLVRGAQQPERAVLLARATREAIQMARDLEAERDLAYIAAEAVMGRGAPHMQMGPGA